MSLADNLASIQQRIVTACARAGRNPASVTLLAVSKGMPPEVVREATDCGLTLFGESKVQEAKVKIPMCPGRLRWQMIGHLQSNKCRDAAHFFEMSRAWTVSNSLRKSTSGATSRPGRCQSCSK